MTNHKPTAKTHHRSFADWLLRDSHGKLAIAQKPNGLLIGWAAAQLLQHIIRHGRLHAGLASLATALLFTWAYLEIVSGSSNIRRLLGAAVMLSIIWRFFS